jgi:hypothetical protein
MGIGHSSRPYRHLRMSRRWLPHRLLRAQSAKRKHYTESNDQRLHHNLQGLRTFGAVTLARTPISVQHTDVFMRDPHYQCSKYFKVTRSVTALRGIGDTVRMGNVRNAATCDFSTRKVTKPERFVNGGSITSSLTVSRLLSRSTVDPLV